MEETTYTKEEAPRLNSLVDIGRNALWNYVTLLVYLRVMRRLRMLLNMLPIVFGFLGSWNLLAEATVLQRYTPLFPFLAGIIPLIYFASGLEENINTSSKLAGRYREVEAQVRDLVLAYFSYTAAEVKERHGRILEQYLELKREAHTVPRWAFRKAERLISEKEYIPIALLDSRESVPEGFSGRQESGESERF